MICYRPPTLRDNILDNWRLTAGGGAVALLGLLYAGRNMLRKRPGNKPPRALTPANIPEKKE